MDGQQSFASIDFSVLRTYGAGDEGFVREVLVLFRDEAAVWGPRLTPSEPSWRAVVHTLKGASRNIGARRLGDLCEAAEEEGEAAALPRIQAELAAVLAEIAAYLGAAP